MRRYGDVRNFLDERIDKELPEVEIERLRSPILNHVGLIDINKALETLSPEAQSALRELYKLGGLHPLYLVRGQIEQDVIQRLDLAPDKPFPSREERDKYGWPLTWMDFGHLQNSFYPVVGGGFIAEVANTQLWRRLMEIPQLSWDDMYPIFNQHSRGSHSLYVAISMVRVLQSLHDKSPEGLLERLKIDFTREGLLTGGETDDEILKLAADMAALVGMTHDIYTPAGGDMMKNIMGLDEEADIENLLTNSGREREAELLALIKGRGLTNEHIQYVIRCVQGRSESLIGEMIHSENGDVLEQDRLAYTIQDSFSAGILGVALPRGLSPELGSLEEYNLINYYYEAKSLLIDRSVLGAPGPLQLRTERPSLSLVEVADNYILDDNLSLVCTRPDKLAWLAALRAMLSVDFYQGAKLRGQQFEFSTLVKGLLGQGKLSEVLNKETLLQINNKELAKRLRQANEPELSKMLSEMGSTFYSHDYESRLVSDASGFDESWFKLPISLKPGLDTKVLDEGKVVSLGEYAKRKENSSAVKLLCEVLDEYHGKTRVVKRAA